MSLLEVCLSTGRRGIRHFWLVLGVLLILFGVMGLRHEQEALSPPASDPVLSSVVTEPALVASVSQPVREEQGGIDYESIPVDLSADSAPAANAPKEKENKPSSNSPASYVVQAGDSLWSIAKAFNVDMQTLVEANDLSRNRYLRVGQKLLIPPGSGVYYRVRAGESLWEICRRYRVDLQEVLRQNRIQQPNLVQVGQQLFLPGASAKRAITDFIWPVRGRLTSGFGMRQHPMGGGWKMHNGVDIAAPSGRLIRAAQGGKVSFAGSRGQMGRCVILQHDDRYQTIYGHCSEVLVKSGQSVQQGQAIARVGSTGLSSGPHVHFEVRKAGRAVDPLPFLP